MFDAPAIELSSTAAANRAARSSGLPRGYVAAWAGLTCLAGLYITQVALQTVNLPQLIANAPATTPAPQVDSGLQAELATVRHSLSEFQRDVGRMRNELESRQQDSATVASLSALEERMSMTTGIALAKTTTPASPAVANAPQAPAVTSTAALEAWTGKPDAIAPEIRPFALAPPALEKLTAPIETGSIASPTNNQPNKMSGQLPKMIPGQQLAAVQVPPAAAIPQQAVAAAPQAPPIAFGPAVVKAEPKPFAVQLASGTSIDEIRYSWSILSEQNADSLGRLQPRYTATASETAGPTFDLLAGPVKTAADAKRICKALAGRGIDCKVASYSGEAF